MSVYLQTISDYLSRNSGLLDVTAAHTVMVWVRNRSSVATTNNTAYAGVDALPFVTDQAGLFTETDQDSLGRVERNGGFFAQASSNLGGGTDWVHLCYTSTGAATNNWAFFVNGTWISGVYQTFNFASFVKTLELLGYNGFDTTADHDFAYFRAWTDDLNVNEILAEMQSATAVRTANLWMDTPLTDDLLDDSGNGRDWTSNGSISFNIVDPLPDNSGYSTATEIVSLPYNVVESADQGGQVFNLWYKYTAPINGAIGIFPTGSTNYEPYIEIFTLIAGVITAYPQPNSITGSPNCPVQVGIETGTTYYIKINSNGGTNVPSTLTLNVQAGPVQSVPVGSILIIDDTDNFPTSIISAVNGSNYNVLKFISPGLAASEGGDIIGDRILFISDTAESSLLLYDETLTLLDTISYTKSTGTNLAYVKANRITNHFWVGDVNPTNPPKFSKYDTAGALVTSFNPSPATSVQAFAPNSDDTKIYIGLLASSAVKVWDIAGAAYDADLVAAISGYKIADMLLLTDGTLLVYYLKNSNPGELYVKRYDDTGALLNTYTLEDSSFNAPAISHYLGGAADDPNSFWVWSHRFGTNDFEELEIFRNIKVDDGTVLATIQHVGYSRGVYALEDDLPPLSRFGPSPSCPFVILREALTPPSGSASLTVIKVTVPSPDTTNTEFTINVGGAVDTPVLTLEDGESHTYTDLAAGIYSVAEEVPAGWAVTYDVSDGSSPAEINLEDGESITVTVTNTRLPGGYAESTLSGIYKIVPEKRNDTLWRSFDPHLEKEVKIPDPFIKTGLIGG